MGCRGRKIFGPKRDEITGVWRRLQPEELYGLYFTPNVSHVINSRRMGWAGHRARSGETGPAFKVLGGNLREIDHL